MSFVRDFCNSCYYGEFFGIGWFILYWKVFGGNDCVLYIDWVYSLYSYFEYIFCFFYKVKFL